MAARRRHLGALGALLTIATTVVAFTLLREPQAPAETPPTTTTTAPSTTTTVPPDVDLGRNEVATAAVPTVAVLAQPPAGTVLDPAATAAGAARVAAAGPYSAERADEPAIPTVERPVQGRRATADGWEFDSPTPWGAPLTFLVTEDHGEWLRVLMPVRPNGTTGWIRAADVARTQIDTRVEVNVSDRTLRAWQGDTLLVDTPVVVGRNATATPLGRLYVTDAEEKYRGSAYGPWILPLSGYSQALDRFAGGMPVIALHGTNRPDLLGSAASNGCIRMPDDVIELLHQRLPLGTPVDIRP